MQCRLGCNAIAVSFVLLRVPRFFFVTAKGPKSGAQLPTNLMVIFPGAGWCEGSISGSAPTGEALLVALAVTGFQQVSEAICGTRRDAQLSGTLTNARPARTSMHVFHRVFTQNVATFALDCSFSPPRGLGGCGHDGLQCTESMRQLAPCDASVFTSITSQIHS